MRARPCLSRNIFSWLINVCSLPGVLNNPVVLFLHVEHLGELYKGDKKTPTWLSRAPRVYIKSWNMLPLLCCELLDWWNYSLSEELQVEAVSLLQQQQPSAEVSPLGFPAGTVEVVASIPFGWSGSRRTKWLEQRVVPIASMEKGRQKEPQGAPTPVFTLHVVASHKRALALMEELHLCKRKGECKLVYQCYFMCGQTHSEKSKQIRKAENCLFNGEQIRLKSTACGWWCSRRAVCVCEAEQELTLYWCSPAS